MFFLVSLTTFLRVADLCVVFECVRMRLWVFIFILLFICFLFSFIFMVRNCFAILGSPGVHVGSFPINRVVLCTKKKLTKRNKVTQTQHTIQSCFNGYVSRTANKKWIMISKKQKCVFGFNRIVFLLRQIARDRRDLT